MNKKYLTEEEKRLAKEYSEGNKFLEKTLKECWERGIKTFASCGGHKEDYDSPYLGIIVDDTSILYIKKIIAQLQNMKNISMYSGVRQRGRSS